MLLFYILYKLMFRIKSLIHRGKVGNLRLILLDHHHPFSTVDNVKSYTCSINSLTANVIWGKCVIKTGDNVIVFMYYHLHQKINLT